MEATGTATFSRFRDGPILARFSGHWYQARIAPALNTALDS